MIFIKTHNIYTHFTISIISTLFFVFILFSFAAFANAATLSLAPSKSSVPVDDTFTVDIILDTQDSATDGVDIHYLNFDPALLEVQEVQAGMLYPSTQTNKFDNTAGTINFSQITTGGSTYTGSGVLATIKFKVLSSGSAKLMFDFESGVTTDTNVASGGSDILTSAEGGKYKLGKGQGFFSWIGNFFKRLFSFLY